MKNKTPKNKAPADQGSARCNPFSLKNVNDEVAERNEKKKKKSRAVHDFPSKTKRKNEEDGKEPSWCFTDVSGLAIPFKPIFFFSSIAAAGMANHLAAPLLIDETKKGEKKS